MVSIFRLRDKFYFLNRIKKNPIMKLYETSNRKTVPHFLLHLKGNKLCREISLAGMLGLRIKLKNVQPKTKVEHERKCCLQKIYEMLDLRRCLKGKKFSFSHFEHCIFQIFGLYNHKLDKISWLCAIFIGIQDIWYSIDSKIHLT